MAGMMAQSCSFFMLPPMTGLGQTRPSLSRVHLSKCLAPSCTDVRIIHEIRPSPRLATSRLIADLSAVGPSRGRGSSALGAAETGIGSGVNVVFAATMAALVRISRAGTNLERAHETVLLTLAV